MMSHRPPTRCPVCGDTLAITGLGCPSCKTELSGHFSPCEFCALGTEQRELLRQFLASRGNIKEIERSLGVSYPTARARIADLLAALGLEAGGPEAPDVPDTEPRMALLEALARGDIDVSTALEGL